MKIRSVTSPRRHMRAALLRQLPPPLHAGGTVRSSRRLSRSDG